MSPIPRAGNFTTFIPTSKDALDAALNTIADGTLKAKQNRSYAVGTTLIGTIATIALAIFASPLFAILPCLATVGLTIYFYKKSKNAETLVSNTSFTLKCSAITKNKRRVAEDTYHDQTLGTADLFKVQMNDGKIVFLGSSNGSVFEAFQDHNEKKWKTMPFKGPVNCNYEHLHI